MSVHSVLSSRITSAADMETMFTATNVRWRRVEAIDKATRRRTHCAFEAIVNGETVLIWQEERGQPFVFQSQEMFFHKKSRVRDMASMSREQILEKAEEQRRVEEERRTQEQEREARRREVAQRMAEKALLDAEEERRRLALEASEIVSRMTRTQTISPQTSRTDVMDGMSEDARRLVGLVLQSNARNKIREQEADLKDRFGLYLDREEILQDGVIELTFSG